MKLFDFSQNQGKVFDIIGKIIDYQTPLKMYKQMMLEK